MLDFGGVEGGDEFDVIRIDVDDKQYGAYDRAVLTPRMVSAIRDRVSLTLT